MRFFLFFRVAVLAVAAGALRRRSSGALARRGGGGGVDSRTVEESSVGTVLEEPPGERRGATPDEILQTIWRDVLDTPPVPAHAEALGRFYEEFVHVQGGAKPSRKPLLSRSVAAALIGSAKIGFSRRELSSALAALPRVSRGVRLTAKDRTPPDIHEALAVALAEAVGGARAVVLDDARLREVRRAAVSRGCKKAGGLTREKLLDALFKAVAASGNRVVLFVRDSGASVIRSRGACRAVSAELKRDESRVFFVLSTFGDDRAGPALRSEALAGKQQQQQQQQQAAHATADDAMMDDDDDDEEDALAPPPPFADGNNNNKNNNATAEREAPVAQLFERMLTDLARGVASQARKAAETAATVEETQYLQCVSEALEDAAVVQVVAERCARMLRDPSVKLLFKLSVSTPREEEDDDDIDNDNVPPMGNGASSSERPQKYDRSRRGNKNPSSSSSSSSSALRDALEAEDRDRRVAPPTNVPASLMQWFGLSTSGSSSSPSSGSSSSGGPRGDGSPGGAAAALSGAASEENSGKRSVEANALLLALDDVAIEAPADADARLDWDRWALEDARFRAWTHNLAVLRRAVDRAGLGCDDWAALRPELSRDVKRRLTDADAADLALLALKLDLTARGTEPIVQTTAVGALAAASIRAALRLGAADVYKDATLVAADKHERALAATVVRPSDIAVTYDAIGGLDEAKAALREAITFPLKFPELYAEGIAADAVKGVLLFGPPGTGKTMLAKAVATEGGANFLAIDASTIENKWLGESEKNAKAVFSLARRLAPCVIFIDEVDSLLSSRETADDTSHGTLTSVKTTLMQEWDGLRTSSERVVVIGSTNRPYDLDEAVLRRMPRRILVDLPDAPTREQILAVSLRGNRLAPDVNLTALALKLHGYSGSDVYEICREAAVQVAHAEANRLENARDAALSSIDARLRPLTQADLLTAIAKLSSSVAENGPEMTRILEWNAQYGEVKKKSNSRRTTSLYL